MGRITRRHAKPKPKLLFRVVVTREEAEEQSKVLEAAARIAGNAGYKITKPHWACHHLFFDTAEKAAYLQARLGRWRHERELAKLRLWPCKVAVQYIEASIGLHAVVWGLSTGIIRDVVRAYRRARYDCGAHGQANWAAAQVILERCPHMQSEQAKDRARYMVEHMLVYIEQRHRDWFWNGLEGAHYLYAFQLHK